MTATRTGHCLRGAATVTVTGPVHVLAGMMSDHETPTGRRRDALAGPTHQMTEAQFLASLNIPASPEE